MALPLLPLRGSRLYVEGLPSSIDDETLSMYFSQYGALEECRVILDVSFFLHFALLFIVKVKESGMSKQFAFVSYSSPLVSQKVAGILSPV